LILKKDLFIIKKTIFKSYKSFYRKMNKKHISVLTLAGSAILLGGCINQNGTTGTPTPTPEPTMSPEPTLEQEAMSPTPSQMIGKEVQSEASYQSPAGPEKVGFKIIVDDTGVIASASAIVEAVNATSKMRQQSFADSFPTVVVGKRIADLKSIDRVGGSSLTTKAFNSVIKDLQIQATN
jgi:hypothetical protein